MLLKDAVKLHQAATERNDLEALSKVEKAYLKVLEREPDESKIIQLLGTLYMQINKVPLCIQLLERAVILDPDMGEAWNNLGNAYRIEHHRERAERCYREAVRCKPENGENWNNLGTNYVNEGEPEEGEKILRNAVKYSPDNSHGWWNLSLVLLEQGKYEEGFPLYRWGHPAGIRYERFYGCPEWDGEETDHLILYGEQGIGDEIMYMSLLPKVISSGKAGRITVDCHPRLITMFKRAFPEVAFHPTRKERIIDWAEKEDFTAKLALADLPGFYIKTWKDFDRKPYLISSTKVFPDGTPDIPKYKNAWGISWEGGKKKTRNDLRSIGLESYLPLIKSRPDITFVSLQYTPQSRETVLEFNKKYGTDIKVPNEVFEFDYDNSLSLITQLDQVITVNTSLVHLCGAAGVKTKVITPYGKAWRYYSHDGKHMAWYGDYIEQYIQEKNEPWENVVKRLIEDLQ